MDNESARMVTLKHLTRYIGLSRQSLPADEYRRVKMKIRQYRQEYHRLCDICRVVPVKV